MGELMDWFAFYLFENEGSGAKPTDKDKFEMLKQFKEKQKSQHQATKPVKNG